MHQHKPYSQLKPLPIPIDLLPFKEISLDWIIGLPLSRKGNSKAYDSILTIVYRVTKYALFISIREDTTVVDFTKLFFKHVECRFSTPIGVFTNRDSRITSGF